MTIRRWLHDLSPKLPYASVKLLTSIERALGLSSRDSNIGFLDGWRVPKDIDSMSNLFFYSPRYKVKYLEEVPRFHDSPVLIEIVMLSHNGSVIHSHCVETSASFIVLDIEALANDANIHESLNSFLVFKRNVVSPFKTITWSRGYVAYESKFSGAVAVVHGNVGYLYKDSGGEIKSENVMASQHRYRPPYLLKKNEHVSFIIPNVHDVDLEVNWKLCSIEGNNIIAKGAFKIPKHSHYQLENVGSNYDAVIDFYGKSANIRPIIRIETENSIELLHG